MLDLRASQYDRQVLRSLCALNALDPRQVLFQYFAIQEEDGVQRLILRGCGDFAADGEVAEEGAEVIGAQLARVAFAVEEDVATDPLQIRLLGSDAVVLDPDDVAHPIEQAPVIRHKDSRRGRWDRRS
jgi:hypothetical protein